MTKYLFAFIFISFFSKSQTLIDDLSINPNPFQKRTSFTYSFINNDTVSVNVLDIIGNTIYSPITNSVMLSGIYQDSLIMDSFSDGVYFAQLKLGHRKTITKKIIKSNTAAIKDNSNSLDEIKIYPNPVTDKLNICSSLMTFQAKLKIINSLGETILVIDNPKQEIDLSFLESGIYYLKIVGDFKQKVLEIIKE